MEWVHCNKCATQPSDGTKIAYFLTNCGHIFCQNCVKTSTERLCLVCRASPVRTVQIGSKMKPDVQLMFQNNCEALKTIYKAYTFQINHSRNMHHLQKQNCFVVGQQLQIVEAQCEALKHKLEQVTKERDKLQSRVDEMGRQRNGGFLARPTSSCTHLQRPLRSDGSNLLGLMRQPQQSNSPTFPDMQINAFDSKTPTAFKLGGHPLKKTNLSMQTRQCGDGTSFPF